MSETQRNTLSSDEQFQQTINNARRACRDMELAGLELQEVIEILERNVREQRLRRLKRLSNV